jgi:hypothetical protein
MAKDWEVFAEKWEDDPVGLVAEVDCTDSEQGGGKALCKYLGIESFPTLKYGDPFDLEEYNGGRSVAELSAFAKENLVPLCSPSRLELCNDETKQVIEKYQKMDYKKLKQLIQMEEEKLETANKEFQAKVDELSKKFEEAEAERKKAIHLVRDGDLGLMRQVTMARQQQGTGNTDEL